MQEGKGIVGQLFGEWGVGGGAGESGGGGQVSIGPDGRPGRRSSRGGRSSDGGRRRGVVSVLPPLWTGADWLSVGAHGGRRESNYTQGGAAGGATDAGRDRVWWEEREGGGSRQGGAGAGNGDGEQRKNRF